MALKVAQVGNGPGVKGVGTGHGVEGEVRDGRRAATKAKSRQLCELVTATKRQSDKATNHSVYPTDASVSLIASSLITPHRVMDHAPLSQTISNDHSITDHTSLSQTISNDHTIIDAALSLWGGSQLDAAVCNMEQYDRLSIDETSIKAWDMWPA